MLSLQRTPAREAAGKLTFRAPSLDKGRRVERRGEAFLSEWAPTFEAHLLYITSLYLFRSFVRSFVRWLCLIAHPHLLVWVTSERWVPAVLATSGSHWLNQLWKCPLLVRRNRSLVARTSKYGWAIRGEVSSCYSLPVHKFVCEWKYVDECGN
jgi:hypothetical protein